MSSRLPPGVCVLGLLLLPAAHSPWHVLVVLGKVPDGGFRSRTKISFCFTPHKTLGRLWIDERMDGRMGNLLLLFPILYCLNFTEVQSHSHYIYLFSFWGVCKVYFVVFWKSISIIVKYSYSFKSENEEFKVPLTVCAAECEIIVQEFLQWHHNSSQIYEEHRHLALIPVSSWNYRVHSMKNKRGTGKSCLLTYQDKSLVNTSVSDKNRYRNLKWSHIFFTLPQCRSFSFLKFWFQNYNHFSFYFILFYTALFKIRIPAVF